MKKLPKGVHRLPSKDTELVLGAGGIKGYGHIGALIALIAAGVQIGVITGVSVGTIIAAFLTNGYTPERILEIFEESIEKRNSFGLLLKCLSTVPDPLSVMFGGWMDLYPAVRQMVEEYDLKPNSRLRVISCDLLKHKPVVFEWKDGVSMSDAQAYDSMAHAITSSCSLPTVFRPQWDYTNGVQLLGDGAIYHYNPTEFCKGPAIVVTFCQATRMPDSWQTWIDLYFSVREIYFPLAGNHRYVDPDKNLVVEVGLPDVAGLNFGISKEKRRALVRNGETTMREAIARARADGRLSTPVKK